MKNLLTNLLVTAIMLSPGIVQAQSGRALHKAEGTWVTHAILPPQVGTGNDGKTPSYAGTVCFQIDGTLSGSPLNQHTGAAFGEWVRTGYREIAFTFVSDTYDSAGNYVNTNRVRGVMTIGDDGLTASGRTLLEILDKTGQVAFTAPSTTTFTATRVTVLSLTN